MPSKVIIIDYGSQVTQLIARRVREAGVYSEIHSCITTAAQVAAMKPSAIILSGGPASVGEADAPVLDPGFLDLGVPVLGICYGMQLACDALGGRVSRAPAREYGRAECEVLDADALLADVRSKGVAAISGNYMFRGVEAVAAPVFNFKNELTMSIVLVGVEGSIDMRDESPVIAHLKDAAHSLSQRLGSTRETAGPP